MFSIKRLKEIINLLPTEVNPRIGGSCALYFYGEVESYRDVDIIVDSIDNIDLPYPKIEFIHKKRLNRGIKYCIDGQEVDILESLSGVSHIVYSEISKLPFEQISKIYNAKQLITSYVNHKDNYPFDFTRNEHQIKSEYKYRPYDDAEEAFNEAKKHGFWIKRKSSGFITLIGSIGNNFGEVYIDGFKPTEFLDKFVWHDDGSPCGVILCKNINNLTNDE